MTTTLFDLIRHGEPEGGPMFRGSQDDPLSELGWRQMREAIREKDQWDVIISSPMLRCREFARELAIVLGIPLHEDGRLREIGFGAWEGKTSAAIMASDGDALQRFWADPVENPPPGGEAVLAFHARVSEAWRHWQQELAGQRVLLVAHGGVIRMILAEVLGLPAGRSFTALAVPYACRSRVRLDISDHGLLQCLESHGPTGV